LGQFLTGSIALFAVEIGLAFGFALLIARFLSFRAAKFYSVFLRGLSFLSPRFGFAKLIEIDRFNQVYSPR